VELDESTVRLRVQAVKAGVGVTLLLAFPFAVWLVWTWQRPYRAEMAWMFGAAMVGALVVSRLPAEKIVRGRHREAFFLSWSAIDIAVITLLAWLDGGIGSPGVLLLFMTLVFAALSYPLGSMISVAAISMLAVVMLQLVGSPAPHDFHPDGAYTMMLLVSLGLTGVLCVWQASVQASHRVELAHLSRTDPLTGCLNRRGFGERLNAELARAERTDEPLGLVQIDLDGFKAVNDRDGHAAGDELLCWVVRTTTALLRGVDAVGRLGGDEFAVLLPGADAQVADEVGHRIGAALAERIGASVGVATTMGDGRAPDALLRSADDRLYANKGRR
jgi:diguanylate cyclase (GGDEF)-like protein